MSIRVCRIPQVVRKHLTANELSGWPDGIAYSFYVKPKKKKKVREADYIPPPKAVNLCIGTSVISNG